MKILTAYVVADIIVLAINGFYTNTDAKILSPDGDTESFDILEVVLQRDTLAPYLFVVALDYAMRIATVNEEDLGLILAKARGRRYPATYICDTDFEGDIALLSNTFNQVQELQKLEAAVRQIGMYTNVSKTELISLNQEECIIERQSGGVELKRIDYFLYPGGLNRIKQEGH